MIYSIFTYYSPFLIQMSTSFTLTVTCSPLMIFMVLTLWFGTIINIIFISTFTIYIYTTTRGWRGRRPESRSNDPPVRNPSLRGLASPPAIPPPQYQERWGSSSNTSGPMSRVFNRNQGTRTHLTTTPQQYPHQPAGNHTRRENTHAAPDQAEYIEVLRHH